MGCGGGEKSRFVWLHGQPTLRAAGFALPQTLGLQLMTIPMCTDARYAVFDTYQKARTTFVQTVADLAARPQNVEALQQASERPASCSLAAD
jgi:hypothetical protein